jgi:ankyrin repeat protein
MDALHWAVNRGKNATIDLLLQWKAPLEGRNIHGTTVLGTAVWSALNEPRPQHMQIIETLLDAGASPQNVRPVSSYVEGQFDDVQRQRVERIETILASRGAA